MPTYEYECPQGHTFEVFQKMTDEPVATCPECGEPANRKISGGAGFLFKGEGFYITDYRSDEYKKKASAESTSEKPAKSEPAKSETSKSEAKSSGGSTESGSKQGSDK